MSYDSVIMFSRDACRRTFGTPPTLSSTAFRQEWETLDSLGNTTHGDADVRIPAMAVDDAIRQRYVVPDPGLVPAAAICSTCRAGARRCTCEQRRHQMLRPSLAALADVCSKLVSEEWGEVDGCVIRCPRLHKSEVRRLRAKGTSTTGIEALINHEHISSLVGTLLGDNSRELDREYDLIEDTSLVPILHVYAAVTAYRLQRLFPDRQFRVEVDETAEDPYVVCYQKPLEGSQ